MERTDQNNTRIDFTPLSLLEWREKFAQIPRSTLLQSYDYARFVAETSALRPRWGVIYGSGRPIGLVQLFVLEWMSGLFSRVVLDRGPCWFSENPDLAQVTDFFTVLNQAYPARMFRRRRVIPELSANPDLHRILVKTGFQPALDILPYQTVWLDLTPPPPELRAQLARNWRGHLAFSERQKIDISFSNDPSAAADLIRLSALDQKRRGYRGLSFQNGMKLARIFGAGDGVVVARAFAEGTFLAGALFLRHGSCATWQIGWVSPAARHLNINSRLLWESILHLRQQKIRALDLGGYNDGDARGVKIFKSGLGGAHVTLLGQYS